MLFNRLFNRRQAAYLLLAGGLAASVSFGLGVVAQENWQEAHSSAGKQRAATKDISYLTNQTVQPVVSPFAADLLRAAALDSQGQIYVTETVALYESKRQRIPASTLHIRSFDREFCLENSPRLRAQWRATLDELAHLGYIEPAAADSLRKTYRMTLAGYEAADRLPTPLAARK